MKKILIFIIIAAALLVTACGSRAAAPEAPVMDVLPSSGGAPAVEQDMFAPEPAFEESTSNSGSGASAAAIERIVIKNADLAIVVSDVQGRMEAIQSMAEGMGGFVVSSNLYQSYTSDNIEVPEATITVRVPAEKLTEALDKIKKDVVEVQSETVSGQDVTAEYVDLQSNLKSLEATEEQLNKILEEATTTEDVVNIFNQLTYYRQQIEVTKGQIKYYEEASALSAISVRIVAEETIKPLVIGKWEPKGVALEATQDLIDFFQGFSEFLIRFIIFTLPVLLTIGFFLYLLFIGARAIFRKLRGSKPKKEQAQEVEKK
jgi:major membrane immunogen (membrane-anchored lipoprotein)